MPLIIFKLVDLLELIQFLTEYVHFQHGEDYGTRNLYYFKLPTGQFIHIQTGFGIHKAR